MIACPENADVCVFHMPSMSRIDSTVDKPKGRFWLDVDRLNGLPFWFLPRNSDILTFVLATNVRLAVLPCVGVDLMYDYDYW